MDSSKWLLLVVPSPPSYRWDLVVQVYMELHFAIYEFDARIRRWSWLLAQYVVTSRLLHCTWSFQIPRNIISIVYQVALFTLGCDM